MNSIEERVSERLERCFARRGFAEPGVDTLREDADVSLRTLYKYFPSRQAMVMSALKRRDSIYLHHLVEDMPAGPGPAPVLHLFRRLGCWLTDSSSTGCLFLAALAAHPDDSAVRDMTRRHKRATAQLIGEALQRAAPGLQAERRRRMTDALMLIHEGQTAMAATSGGKAATDAALAAAGALLGAEDIH